MANYTAADVKKLREQTGAGMLDCKNALVESDGDYDKAMEYLRVKGQKGVAKRESRTASQGAVAAYTEAGVGTLVELDCETDFVSKGDKFQVVLQQVLDQAVAVKAADVDSLLKSEVADGRTVQALLDDANASIGEKIELRAVARLEAPFVASYLHRTSPDLPPQVGVLFGASGESDVVRDIALHIAALPPLYLSRDEVPADVVENERRIAEATAREEGKPEGALPKIVEGRVTGFFKENVLVEQKFAKDQGTTVQKVLDGAGITAVGFYRFRVGV
ncbi:translation elongation factor Ts [Kineosporia succinea]|uniref:Elongation factor Ts n=1 Tax=Kineosporia succinea TaxID=84632 RepID=A0ABT9NWB7_9ACTN|nr:translation elongation factor Ts [Kineosporia succinea]MDP9824718.1 elongation factor Ts [Kineosporia succinea]